MKKTQLKVNTKIKSLDDILKYEKTSSSVSDKYVSIKTSQFVKKLTQSDEFRLVGGAQYRKGSTGHYIELARTGSDNAITLYMENSFDRTIALRVAFNYRGFIFGRIKQVHKGVPAKTMIDNVGNIKSWYNNAVNAIDGMRNFDLNMVEMQHLARVAFKTRGINLSQITNMSYRHKSALDYVLYLTNGIKDGTFTRTSTKGIIELKPVTQGTLLVQINSKLWNEISSNYPHLYI